MREFVQETTRFQYVRLGGGTFIALTQHDTARTAFLQGDDALQFDEEMDATETCHPDFDLDQRLAWLWDQCGYGDAAQ